MSYQTEARHHIADSRLTDCGTVACHAGWYLFGKRLDAGNEVRLMYSHDGDCWNCEGTELEFQDGAMELAQDLGFPTYGNMVVWAGDHPDLWGNDEGRTMCRDNIAFGRKRVEEVTLSDIADHWHAVADRIEALEASQ